MKEVSYEKKLELMSRAVKLKYHELITTYMVAAMMVEAGVSPAEMVAYLEANFMEVDAV